MGHPPFIHLNLRKAGAVFPKALLDSPYPIGSGLVLGVHPLVVAITRVVQLGGMIGNDSDYWH